MILDAAQFHKWYLTLAFHHFTLALWFIVLSGNLLVDAGMVCIVAGVLKDCNYLSYFCWFVLDGRYGRNPAKPVGMENMSQVTGLATNVFCCRFSLFFSWNIEGKLPFSAADTRKFLGHPSDVEKLRCWWCRLHNLDKLMRTPWKNSWFSSRDMAKISMDHLLFRSFGGTFPPTIMVLGVNLVWPTRDLTCVFFTSFSHFAIKRDQHSRRLLFLASLHSAISKNHWVWVTKGHRSQGSLLFSKAGKFSVQSPRVSKLPVWGAQRITCCWKWW